MLSTIAHASFSKILKLFQTEKLAPSVIDMIYGGNTTRGFFPFRRSHAHSLSPVCITLIESCQKLLVVWLLAFFPPSFRGGVYRQATISRVGNRHNRRDALRSQLWSPILFVFKACCSHILSE